MNNLLAEVIAQRVFTVPYIWVDTVFIIFFCVLLFATKRYLTLIFALFGGVLYMAVDYGIFHLALHTRTIEGGNIFWVLLWMSLSYGITNFAWIWFWLGKDKRLAEWSLLICVWWIAAPQIASLFGGSQITISRTTGSYHGVMGLILILGYGACIVYNLFQKEKLRRFPLMWMVAIGVLVQFAWEFSLLIGGIRSAAISDWGAKFTTLAVNSLLETNLGIPIIEVIYTFVTARISEDFKKRDRVAFTSRLAELNAQRARG